MQNEINTLIETIKTEYLAFTSRNGTKELSSINQLMISEFNEGVESSEGNKYIKILTNGGGRVWGFVVKGNDDKKFAQGDILMAAGFNSPARNKARGNVFDDYSVDWTGPKYLRG